MPSIGLRGCSDRTIAFTSFRARSSLRRLREEFSTMSTARASSITPIQHLKHSKESHSCQSEGQGCFVYGFTHMMMNIVRYWLVVKWLRNGSFVQSYLVCLPPHKQPS